MAVLAVAAVGAAGLPIRDSAGAAAAPTALYVVELADSPLGSYDGHLAELARTAPLPGGRLDAFSTAARGYAMHLARTQDAVLSTADVPQQDVVYRTAGTDATKVVASYDTASNGFAATLTGARAAKSG